MALIKCPECGQEISDTSAQCIKCGAVLKTTNTKKKSGKMFAGFLLNIFAVVIPLLLILGINQISEPESSGGISVEMTADYSSATLLIIMIIGLAIFALGLVIYFAKNIKLQKILSVLYLVAAVADLCWLVVNTLTYLLATCGLGVFLYVPGILQVVAGTKYVSETRKYEA